MFDSSVLVGISSSTCHAQYPCCLSASMSSGEESLVSLPSSCSGSVEPSDTEEPLVSLPHGKSSRSDMEETDANIPDLPKSCCRSRCVDFSQTPEGNALRDRIKGSSATHHNAECLPPHPRKTLKYDTQVIDDRTVCLKGFLCVTCIGRFEERAHAGPCKAR